MKRTIDPLHHGAQPSCLICPVLKHWDMCSYLLLASITAGGHNFGLAHSKCLPQSQGNYSLSTLEISGHDGRLKKKVSTSEVCLLVKALSDISDPSFLVSLLEHVLQLRGKTKVTEAFTQ